MRVAILGPLEVADGDGPVQVRGVRPAQELTP